MKFENTQVFNFRGAIRGMRNPMNSWDKSDSFQEGCDQTPHCYLSNNYRIGKNDLSLMQKLIRAGSEHRKFMRQIFVSVDITAPLYWFKEFSTYKVGTVENSTSTMHKLATTPITIHCFETDDYDASIICKQRIDCDNNDDRPIFDIIEDFIFFLESLRKKYLDTKDKRYWKELIRWLPESWMQTCTVTMNYENLLAMCSKGQRRFHKLNEWSGIDNPELQNFISWARTLPYAQELIFLDELDKEED